MRSISAGVQGLPATHFAYAKYSVLHDPSELLRKSVGACICGQAARLPTADCNKPIGEVESVIVGYTL